MTAVETADMPDRNAKNSVRIRRERNYVINFEHFALRGSLRREFSRPRKQDLLSS